MYLIVATAVGASSPTDGELIQIRNHAFGELLRPFEASRRDGAPLVLYPAQAWKCMTWKVVLRPDGGMSLQNQFSLKTLSAEEGEQATTGPVRQVPWPTAITQAPAWRWERIEADIYKIVEPISGRVLTAIESAEGIRVVVMTWQGLSSQMWELRPAPAKLTM